MRPHPHPCFDRAADRIGLRAEELCLETAGWSLENVLKCKVFGTTVERFATVNAIYARYFPKGPNIRPRAPLAGDLDSEVDCTALRKDFYGNP
jgi:2-iminobutanoate/2-iminopropanoate deaminase